MTRARALLAAALLVLVGLEGTPEVSAQQRGMSEYAVRGAFVYNVINFVEWPASALAAGAPLRIVVVGAGAMADFPSAFAGRQVRGHALVVEQRAGTDDLSGAHVVFVATEAAPQLRAVVRAVERHPVLTIAEQNLEAPGPAIVALGVAQARLAFAVNLDAADTVGLQISPNLLKLARSVQSRRAAAGR